MKLLYCFMIVLCPLLGTAQTAPVLKPLSIGDDMPNLVFSSVLNAPYNSTSIAAHPDKLVLLDFWATWCASCIEGFPKLDSLQSKFDGRLQIILVNNYKSGDTREKINTLLSRVNKRRRLPLRLPIAMGDSMAWLLFPHSTVPHTVWVWRGMVVGITNAADVNASNISAVMQDDYSVLDLKADLEQFDNAKPLLDAGNRGDLSMLLSRTSFTRYLPGAKNGIGLSFIPGVELQRRYYINQPLIQLYLMAYFGIAGNRVVLEDGIDKDLLNQQHKLAWKKAHFFSYELTVPKGTSNEQMKAHMRQDLDCQFGYRSRIEKRLLDCLVLVRTADSNKLTPATLLEDTGFYKNNDGNWRLNHIPISYLCKMLNVQSPGRPLVPVVLDETRYKLPVSMDLKVADIHDSENLRLALRQYGFDLVPSKREIEVLVISKQILLPKIN